jgi:antitoxin ParD1/3/4
MPKRVTLNVSLTPSQKRDLERLVRSGRYDSASDVLRTGLEVLQKEEDRLRSARAALERKIAAGLDDIDQGRTEEAGQVFARLIARTELRARAGRKKAS